MVELNPTEFKTRPYAHQLAGTRRLVADPHFALFDEMGAGKSKQVVDAACALAAAGQLRTVVVLAPANVRGVWLAKDDDPELDGQIHRHGWRTVGHRVLEFHAKRRGSHWREVWRQDWRDDRVDRPASLDWVVSNYEFVRGPGMKERLVAFAEDGPSLLVLDESSFLINHQSKQWRAVKELRAWFDRCVLLNGTPTTNNPLDLWGQFEIMDDQVFGARFKNFYHFRWQFAEMLPQRHRGVEHSKIIGFRNLDELRALVAPHALRRLKADCLDLPPKTYTTREVPLTKEAWARYVELRRDAIVTLADDDVQVEPNAAVRLLRLSQLTSGILGRQVMTPSNPQLGIFEAAANPAVLAEVRDLSDEKLAWCVEHLLEWDTAVATIVWCRWVRERERLVRRLRDESSRRHQPLNVYELYGRQPGRERERAIAAFQASQGAIRRVLVAQPHAGGFGLNLTAATTVVYLSNDYSLRVRLQSEDRCHRPGQRHPVTYVDVIATGPRGQATVDRTVVRALRTKQELADWTSRAWRRELEGQVADEDDKD